MDTTRHLLVLFCLVLLACAPGSETAAPVGATLAIRDVVLLDPLDGAGGPSTLLIDGERIVAVGPPGAIAVPGGVPTLDGTGLFLIPGLWNLHTHLTNLDDFAPRLMVTQGVTGARNMGSKLEEIDELRQRIASGDLLGPRIARAGPTLNGAQNGPHHRVIGSPQEAMEAVTELRALGVDFLKTHNATERDTYFGLLETAEAAGLDVVGHVPTTVSPLEACEAGQASIEHIATIFEGTYLGRFESELEAFQGMYDWDASEAPVLADCFARQQTLFVPTLRAYEVRAHRADAYDNPDPRLRYVSAATRERWFDTPPNEMDRRQDIVELRSSLVDVGQKLAARLHAAGAPIGAGTDLAGPFVLPGFGLHREIELLVEAGLTPQAALWASARGPGPTAGGDPLTGRLTAGAPADLVLLRDNVFQEISALSEIEAVVVRGRPLDRTAIDRVLGELEAEASPRVDWSFLPAAKPRTPTRSSS